MSDKKGYTIEDRMKFTEEAKNKGANKLLKRPKEKKTEKKD